MYLHVTNTDTNVFKVLEIIVINKILATNNNTLHSYAALEAPEVEEGEHLLFAVTLCDTHTVYSSHCVPEHPLLTSVYRVEGKSEVRRGRIDHFMISTSLNIAYLPPRG